MTPDALTRASNQDPMQNALDDEIFRLERIVAGVTLVLSALGFLICVYIALVISWPLGLAMGVFSLFLVAWFALVRFSLARGIGARYVQWINPLVEISIPSVVVLIDVSTQGAGYAISQSVPVQLYAILTAVTILRLERFMPLLVASVGLLEYVLLYLFYLRPELSGPPFLTGALRPGLIAIRCAFILLGGVICTLVSMGLRRAVNQAAGEVRAQELFGKYRIGDQIAAGGMGVVYRATYCPEGGFQRPVALKRIHPHLASVPNFVNSFRREAELCSRLVHPNIVQVLDFGRVEDTYFQAMEFVDGMTLLELIQRCKQAGVWMPANLVAWVGREICAGLAFAHTGARDDGGRLLRVVHRDLSPPNVLASYGGQVKVLDFGIAKALGEASNTLTGRVVGKLGYMAPEQVNGEPLDERIDLFAAAIIVWELLCLRPLFNRANEATTLMAVLSAPVPAPSSLREGLAEDWDRFFVRGLQRGKELRFQSAAEMLAALDALLELEGTPRPDELEEFLVSLPAPQLELEKGGEYEVEPTVTVGV